MNCEVRSQTSGVICVDMDKSSVGHIWGESNEVIMWLKMEVNPFLGVFGVSFSSISKLCRYFYLYQDLLDEVKSFTPKVIIIPDPMVMEENLSFMKGLKETLESSVTSI